VLTLAVIFVLSFLRCIFCTVLSEAWFSSLQYSVLVHLLSNMHVCMIREHCVIFMLLVDCVEGDGTQTKTTNGTDGNVQMRPKPFPGYVMQLDLLLICTLNTIVRFLD